MPFYFFCRHVVQVRSHRAQIRGLQEIPIVLKNAFRAMCPFAMWPRFPYLYHALRKKEAVESTS